MNKCVGIVVPSYNQGKYLAEALESIILNKRHCEIEIVVMDGGSSDNSLEIIQRYEKDLYYWKSSHDKGQANAINMGMEHLKHCDYVMWLNSDDVYDDEYAIVRQLDFMEKTGARICYGKSRYINETGTVIGQYRTRPFDRQLLGRDCYISQPSVMVAKDLWFELGGLNEKLQMCLDYEMWIRASQICDLVYFEDYVGNTRIYSATKTSTMQGRSLTEGIIILKQYYDSVPDNWILEKLRHDCRLLKDVPDCILLKGVRLFKNRYIDYLKSKYNF